MDPALLAISAEPNRTQQTTIPGAQSNPEERQKRPRDNGKSSISASDSDSDSEDEEDEERNETTEHQDIARIAASLGLKPESQHALKLFIKVRDVTFCE